jgi:hypothetical protein
MKYVAANSLGALLKFDKPQAFKTLKRKRGSGKISGSQCRNRNFRRGGFRSAALLSYPVKALKNLLSLGFLLSSQP